MLFLGSRTFGKYPGFPNARNRAYKEGYLHRAYRETPYILNLIFDGHAYMMTLASARCPVPPHAPLAPLTTPVREYGSPLQALVACPNAAV